MHALPYPTAQPQDMLLDYLMLFGTKSCVFEDLRAFLDVFPEEAVNMTLRHFEAMVVNDPVNFDCQDSEIKENVSSLQNYCCYMYKSTVHVLVHVHVHVHVHVYNTMYIVGVIFHHLHTPSLDFNTGKMQGRRQYVQVAVFFFFFFFFFVSDIR